MRAAFYSRRGPAHEVLDVGDLPTPQPGPGEVRVRVHASAVNPSDTKARSGWGGNAPLPFPRVVPHQDGAGIVDAVGAGVDAARVGERVWVYEAQWQRPSGTAAEYTTVPAHKAVALPDDVGFDVGACLGIPAMTAHRALFADGPVTGRAVLVQGGAGAVGTAAILLARWAGARVITTVSRPAQAAVAEAAGAHVVVNRRTEDVAARVREATRDVNGGAGVDRVVEVDLAANLDADLACLAPNGVVSFYASPAPDAAAQFVVRRAMSQNAVLRGFLVYTMGDEAHRAAVRDVTACLAAGAYRPAIAERLPLDRIADGHELQDSGRAVGKIVFDVA
jgi:NADPH:quinone reductase-like Zn-dependent oxidoreductase